MERKTVTLKDGTEVELVTLHTLIIGSGAASLNCAEHLYELGVTDIAIATDKLGAGTSNNSGSDKQTYYKLGIFGDVPDSPMALAHTLFDGGMMHGDLAYIEALCSAQEFFHLVRNGVPFPHNRYGAYVGYKTDFDPRQRATSAGPRTSRFMVEDSLANVRRNGTFIFDGCEVIALLSYDGEGSRQVAGAVALQRDRIDSESHGITLFNAANVVMGTGGPGEMYRDSVYPPGQIGNHGLALEIGAVANNLGESQFGLASTNFRWNLSGTYQQAIPCYYSTDSDGGDRRYFLNDYFESMTQVASNTFLKGYQWPFHAGRLQDLGSSVVDFAVYNETRAGRKVYMDFTLNPVASSGMEEFSLELLDDEARQYLARSGAVQATPYERLRHMNPLAVELYREQGIDLSSEPLPAAVCAQHNNGGLMGNVWWESNLRHLFPIGEVCGTHGVRPGGSALNSGQVGGLRAAQYIANVYKSGPLPPEEFLRLCEPQIERELQGVARYLNASASAPSNEEVRCEIQDRMTEHGAFVRSEDGVSRALAAARSLLKRIRENGIRLRGPGELNLAFQNEHLCLTHVAFLATMDAYIRGGGGSRGGYVIVAEDGDLSVDTKRGSEWPHRSENRRMRGEILETVLGEDGRFRVRAVNVRPLPEDTSWYETVWQAWRSGEIFRG